MSQSPAQAAPVVNSEGAAMRPHRGTMIMVLSILGLMACFAFGIVAWVMGNGDLKLMDAGLMDPDGRGITAAGRVLGIIGTFTGLIINTLLIIALIAVAGFVMAAAGGAGGP